MAPAGEGVKGQPETRLILEWFAGAPGKVVKFLNGLHYTVLRPGKGMGAFAGAKVGEGSI